MPLAHADWENARKGLPEAFWKHSGPANLISDSIVRPAGELEGARLAQIVAAENAAAVSVDVFSATGVPLAPAAEAVSCRCSDLAAVAVGLLT
jgi:hypothetical protein